MAKIFAKVNGLHKIFNIVENDLGQLVYDTTSLKEDVLTNYNVNENTIFYIETDEDDHQLDYKGTYVYSHNELFSNYDNKGGQYIQTNIDVEHNTTELGYAFGKITPLVSDASRLWNISYHIQAYSTNTDYNSEYDVCLYGYNNIILGYCAFNAIGSINPYLNHIIIKDDNGVKVGISFIADGVDRGISIIINDYKKCNFEQISETNINVEALNVIKIDATNSGFTQKEKEINFTPTGTVSTPIFNGTEASITVSGQVVGTNSASAVTIDATTTSINSLTSVGELPSFTYTDNSELVSFNAGELPESEEQTVWTGYNSATAAAQVFNGATVTFSGTFTPSGTISTPTFTGNEITIKI